MIRGTDWSQRKRGAETLGRIGGKAAVEALANVLLERKRKEDTGVLQAVIEALRRIGDPAAIPSLMRVANWRNPLSMHEEDTREAAGLALSELVASRREADETRPADVPTDS